MNSIDLEQLEFVLDMLREKKALEFEGFGIKVRLAQDEPVFDEPLPRFSGQADDDVFVK